MGTLFSSVESENDVSSSSKSLLPENVIVILNKGMREGFKDDSLSVYSKNINDSMMPELCEWIVKLDDKVKILDLGINQITSVGASMLFDTLKSSNSSIKVVILSDNKQVGDKCMKSLGKYIKSNKYIERISLGWTSISDAGIEILAPYLDGNTTFKQLWIADNKGITDKSKPLLMKMIESSCIEHIAINGTSITQKNPFFVFSVCKVIKNGSDSLDLYDKGINDDDLIKICDAMKKYGIDKLKVINLKSNKITSKGASVLFDTLKECNSVVSILDLSSNQIDDECMKKLGEYLQDNEYLKELRLANNDIKDKGVETLFDCFIGNTTLKVLNLNGNYKITDASTPHLFRMANISNMTHIHVSDTSVSEQKQKVIIAGLLFPIDKRKIPIKSNTKSAAKISAST